MLRTTFVSYLALVLLCLFAAPGCSASVVNVTCNGGGGSCSCAGGQVCNFSPQSCSGSCSLGCADGSTCRGSCGESCSISCGTNTTCEATLGASGSVSCGNDSDCHITCTDSCSVSCGSGANCSIRCAGDTAARTFSGSASCP